MRGFTIVSYFLKSFEMQIFDSALLLAGVLLILYVCLRIRRWIIDRNIINKIPGPPSYPLIGNIDVLVGLTPGIYCLVSLCTYNIYFCIAKF